MIKDTLEELKKRFPYGLQKTTLTEEDGYGLAEAEKEVAEVFLTSHISYLDEKIKETGKMEFVYDKNAGVFTQHSVGYKQAIEDITKILQKEKSQAEELLKGL